MPKNPYTLIFGKEPLQMISRTQQLMMIVEEFTSSMPSQQVFLISGVRGSGKTVLMTEVMKRLQQQEEWITVELNPSRDMLTALASKLSSNDLYARIFQKAKINLSFFGFGLEVSGIAPITDVETALSKMIGALRDHGKRLLITVDEVVNTEYLRIFSSTFQILVREDLPVFLLMTGLFENIRSLQDEKNLTFLYRAPRMELKPLNIGTIAANYRNTIGVGESESLHMAKLTKGYPFAFQVLGFFAWEHGGMNQTVLEEYQRYLEEYVYEKIWSELSMKDRQLAYAVAISENGKISEIRQKLGIDTNQFNPYRKRLIQKGILNGDVRGYVSFTLPLFEKYVVENVEDADKD